MMQLAVTQKETRSELFHKVACYLDSLNLSIASEDLERPWGGFYAISEHAAERFCRVFFPELDLHALRSAGKISPKVLMVEPIKKLSWQYHKRRAEIWKLIGGEVGISTSATDKQEPVVVLQNQETIQLAQGQRHRLIGRNGWGIIAEIWQHTDPAHPSDESDIIRLQDDFGREYTSNRPEPLT